MRYWWVNHKQTFRQEFGGKYVWCPKRKTDGRLSHFYETVREVQPGDIVFSYANAQLQGFGYAKTYGYSCPRPDEFGQVGEAWDVRGWRADVDFRRFESPVKPTDYTGRFGPLLPNRYSPIRANGYGNQGAYFSEIPELLANLIFELADPILAQSMKMVNESSDKDLIEIELPSISSWEDHQQFIIQNETNIAETQRKALVQARIGQGLFKKRVYQNEKACRITKVNNLTHLIASHIKPWRESDNEERLHEANGLMLTPTIDHLFDRGFISFADDGKLLTSPVADKDSLGKMGVETNSPILVGNFNIDQKYFLNYHREEIFLKSAS